MKAFQIDVDRCTVSEIDVSSINSNGSCIPISSTERLHVGQGGLHKDRFFLYEGIKIPVQGHALVLGVDASGKLTSPTTNIGYVRNRVKFVELRTDTEGKPVMVRAKPIGEK